MSEEKTNMPTTASEYANAIQGRSDGQFTSRFKDQARLMLATIHGAPFFAISRLAPELSKKATLSILIVDSNGWYSQEGGRWLSLYAKAIVADEIAIFDDHLEAFLTANWTEWGTACAIAEAATGICLAKNQLAYRATTLKAEGAVPEMLLQILAKAKGE